MPDNGKRTRVRNVATTILAAGALVYLTVTIALGGAGAAAEAAGIVGGFALVLTALGLLRQRSDPPAHRTCPDAPPRPAIAAPAFGESGRTSCPETPHGPILPLGWLVLNADDGRPMVGGPIRELRALGGRLPDGMVLVLYALPEWHAPPGRLVMTFGIGATAP